MKFSDFSTVGLDLIGLLRSSRWNHNAIKAYQAKKLVEMMRYAVTNVPYYRSTGLTASDIQTPRDLDRFPIIDKAKIRKYEAEFIADGMDISSLDCSVTSGSTGEPTTTYFDRATWLHDKYAQKIRRMIENRIGIFSRVIIASEFGPDRLAGGDARYLPGDGLLFKQRRISVHESPSNHIAIFRDFRPHAFYTFPSYISELMDYCDSQSIQLPPIKTVFTSSEVLTDTLRRRISAFFSAQVCDVYGCAEYKEVAWECSEGRRHVNFESVHVESLPNAQGDDSSLILTTLRNRATPLLRYRIGDFGQVRGTLCPCGKQSPWIDSIAGREVDILVLPSGRRVSPYVLINESIDHTKEILKHQFVQTSPNRLEIHVALTEGGRGLDELQHLVHEVMTRLDGEMDVKMVDVDRIPLTSGGKQRVLIRSADSTRE